MEVHLLVIELSKFSSDQPLFNHEAVYKTLKGYFHDLKRLCLSEDEYNHAGPLFFYSVDRGSGIWKFLGELRQLLLFGTTLSDQKVIGQQLTNLDKRLEILSKYFGNGVSMTDFNRFMNAKTPAEIEYAFGKLIEQQIVDISISDKPFKGELEEAEDSLRSIKDILDEADNS